MPVQRVRGGFDVVDGGDGHVPVDDLPGAGDQFALAGGVDTFHAGDGVAAPVHGRVTHGLVDVRVNSVAFDGGGFVDEVGAVDDPPVGGGEVVPFNGTLRGQHRRRRIVGVIPFDAAFGGVDVRLDPQPAVPVGPDPHVADGSEEVVDDAQPGDGVVERPHPAVGGERGGGGLVDDVLGVAAGDQDFLNFGEVGDAGGHTVGVSDRLVEAQEQVVAVHFE